MTEIREWRRHRFFLKRSFPYESGHRKRKEKGGEVSEVENVGSNKDAGGDKEVSHVTKVPEATRKCRMR